MQQLFAGRQAAGHYPATIPLAAKRHRAAATPTPQLDQRLARLQAALRTQRNCSI